MPIFEPPTVEEGPLGGGPLLGRYKLTRGITLLKNNGVYTEHRYPLDSECEAADIAYIGGHIYFVTDEEAADLIAAGYPDLGDHGYGDGHYGDDEYGDPQT